MIACLFHNRAIRHHLDDSAPLPPTTKAHLQHCAHCRDELALHSTVIKTLAATAPRLDAPPFLHARVTNALRQTPAAPSRSAKIQWAAATCAIGLFAISIALLPPKRNAAPAPSWPELNAPITLNASFPENPLEAEINNLRADTLNAAKALAATFLPSREDSN